MSFVRHPLCNRIHEEGVVLKLSKNNMPFDDCELSEGVSYEVLQENKFTRQISSYTNGFVRLHPNNQVAKDCKKAL